MSKILKPFFIVVTFMVGLSLGMYYGVDSNEIKEVEEKKKIDSVQDIVIKNVQSENKKIEDEEEDLKEVISKEERISPYAKMMIEKKFTKCGHTKINVLDVPKELINLNKEELYEKYSGWEIKKFSKDEFILYREINANCDDHFVLKENDGYIAVYNELTDDISNLVEKTEIDVNSLREEDKNELLSGIRIYGREEVNSLIEDFES